MISIDLFCNSSVKYLFIYFFLVKIVDGIQNSLKRILQESGGTFFATNIFLRPKSRGTIRLQSTDPFDPPLIDPSYLGHPDDITNFMKGKYSSFFKYNYRQQEVVLF